MIHCDVYQPKNAKNIGIPPKIVAYITGSIVNAIMQPKIGNDPGKIHPLFMNNLYFCAYLFVLFIGNFNTIHADTIRSNQLGWPNEFMTLTKSQAEATRKYDLKNKVLMFQWMDNKVLLLTLTYQTSDDADVSRRMVQNFQT